MRRGVSRGRGGGEEVEEEAGEGREEGGGRRWGRRRWGKRRTSL